MIEALQVIRRAVAGIPVTHEESNALTKTIFFYCYVAAKTCTMVVLKQAKTILDNRGAVSIAETQHQLAQLSEEMSDSEPVAAANAKGFRAVLERAAKRMRSFSSEGKRVKVGESKARKKLTDAFKGKLGQALQLAAGVYQKFEGASKLYIEPAWELVRLFPRKVPRGSPKSNSPGWPTRWLAAGGELNRGRMIATKGNQIWARLGDSGEFPDACDVDHPPFAWNSGFGWRGVSRDRAARAGLVPDGVRPDSRYRPTQLPASDPMGSGAFLNIALANKIKQMGGTVDLELLSREVANTIDDDSPEACASRTLLLLSIL